MVYINLNNVRDLSKNPIDLKITLAFLDFIKRKIPDEEHGKKGQDHITGILEQLARSPKQLPKLTIVNKKFDELAIEDF
jgi:thymidylate synthase